jgi:hypothetical protein
MNSPRFRFVLGYTCGGNETQGWEAMNGVLESWSTGVVGKPEGIGPKMDDRINF